MLTSAAPHLRERPASGIIQPATVDEASLLALCENLDDSYLFVQGPPGSGKTYLGARLIVNLLARGKRVGITANSHKAIHNLLDEVERVAAERNFAFTGLKKCTKDDDATVYTSAHISSNEKSIADPNANLVAGTAWAFGVQAMDRQLDYLFIDEAGQVALPHAVAVMTSAKSTILLGDPLQLAQVSHTAHPGDLGASVLEHVLDRDLRPVAPDRGVLLTNSYRMHPDVCAFISELLYEGRLRSAPDREHQHVASPGLSGTGLRYLPFGWFAAPSTLPVSAVSKPARSINSRDARRSLCSFRPPRRAEKKPRAGSGSSSIGNASTLRSREPGRSP